jgi:membrane-associated protease RseP (regulator of RpoE activity)
MTTTVLENSPTPLDFDRYTDYVQRIFRIEDITWGTDKQNFLVRYRGSLIKESMQAYEELAASLRPLNITPTFREEDEQQVIYLLAGTQNPRPSKIWVNILLFALTGVSVVISSTYFYYAGPSLSNWDVIRLYLPEALKNGLLFSVALLAILLSHEFGHYLAGRFHKTAVTLPYFIPFPLSPFGTMGAFIQLKESPRNKRFLLDIGLTGPLVGLAVAIPLVFLGLYLSKIDTIPAIIPAGQAIQLEGNSLFYLLAKFIVFKQWLPSPVSYEGLHPFIYWVRFFFTGRPAPMGGMDVMLHPFAYAGWVGLLITALNLIPAGQLDGGHSIFVLLGKKARMLLPFILGILIILGFFWMGWWLWAGLIFLLGRVYAEPLDQITPLDQRRKVLAILSLVIFILVFTPIPLSIYGAGF